MCFLINFFGGQNFVSVNLIIVKLALLTLALFQVVYCTRLKATQKHI